MVQASDGSSSDFVLDEELVFESEEAPAAPPPAPRRLKKGETQVAPAAPAEPAPAAAAPEPAAPAEAAPPAPAHDPRPLRGRLVAALAVSSLFCCLLSLGGLFAVGHTLAQVQAERARTATEAQALAQVPAMVARLNDAARRLDEASIGAAAAAAPPVTLDQLHHELDGLRLALAARRAEPAAPTDQAEPSATAGRAPAADAPPAAAEDAPAPDRLTPLRPHPAHP